MSFEAGTVVWVKLTSGRLWWAGEVTNEFPDSLLSRNRTDPIAVVKFFSDENEFEVIKKQADIVLYNNDRKAEFIKKGKSHLAKCREDLKKFIDDCKKAESLTGGNEDTIDALETTQNTPRKSVYAELFKPSPLPTPSKPAPSPGHIKLPFRKTGTPVKRPRLSIPTPQIVEGKKFSCDECGFTSDRITVLTSHRRSHTGGTVASTSSTPPVKPKSQAKVAPVEKAISPKKPNSPKKSISPKKPVSIVKTLPTKRGRKRKAPIETTPLATDKQEILADWSDAEEGNAESPLDADLEPKKPRTDQELHDAFESLLKTTKPPDEVDLTEESVKPCVDSTNTEGEDKVVQRKEKEDLVLITDDPKEQISQSGTDITEEESITITTEKSTTIPEEESTTITEEKSATIPEEESTTITEKEFTIITAEKSTTNPEEESTTITEEKLAIVTDEESTTFTEEKFTTVTEEKSTTITEEKSSNFSEEEFTTFSEEKSTTITEEKTTTITEEKSTTITEEKSTVITEENSTAIIKEKSTTITEENSITIVDEGADSPNQASAHSYTETVSQAEEEELVAAKVEVEESLIPESPIKVPSVAGSPTAKVIGVSKVIKSPSPERESDTNKDAEKLGTDDVDQLENEVEALLAATKPVEINHKELFASRPDLHYTVSPVKLKKFESVVSPPLVTTEEYFENSAQGLGNPENDPTPTPVTPTKSTVPMATPVPSHVIPSTTAVNSAPQTPTKVITMAHTMAVKSPPPPVELIKPGMGGVVPLKITKSPPPPLLQERIVVLPPDSLPTNPMKSLAPLVYSGPGITPQAVKVYSTLPVSSAATVLNPVPKKGRVKKQTLTERVGVVQTSPTGMTQINYPTLTGGQLVSSPLGSKVLGAPVQTVQSLQTKIHALPTTSPTIGLKATPAGMVRLSGSTIQQQGLRGSTSPSILTKPMQQIKYQRQQTPLFVASPTSSHYELVTSGVGTKQEANELILVSQPAQPQQQYVLASTSAMGGVMPQAMKPGQKKRPPKKTVTAPVVKAPEVAKAKPTAAVKPQLSEEEKLNSAKIRQALLAGQKTEKILTAERVVHLLPMENSDGTVTYMLVHMDEVGGGIQIDQADAAKTNTDVDPVFADTGSSAEQLLQAIIQKHPTPVAHTSRKVTNRKGQALSRGTGVIQQRARAAQPGIIAQTQQLHLQQGQHLQNRHVVIGQQQHVLQMPVQRQSTISQQFQHIVQPHRQPAPVAQYQFVQSQRQLMVGQQQVQRSVFVTQTQQIAVSPHQQHHHQHQVMSKIQTQTEAITTQQPQIQQQMIHTQQPSPVTHVPVATQSYQVQQIQEPIQQQEDAVPQVQVEEPRMPPLVDTKSRGITLLADTSALQPEPIQEEGQRLEGGQQQMEASGTVEDTSIGTNAEVPMEVQQDYQVQIITAEDGTQYYLTPDGIIDASLGYFQLQTEGDGAAYDLGGEQFLIMQEDGTCVTPQELGMDLEQCRALQQQQEQQLLEQQQVLEHQDQQQNQ